MSPELSSNTLKPKKKPPACDHCKARRVLCHPQPYGKSCPRCAEKGVKCTTTPSIRRRRIQHEVAAGQRAANNEDISNEDHNHAMDVDAPFSQDQSLSQEPAYSPSLYTPEILLEDNTPTLSPAPSMASTISSTTGLPFVHTNFNFNAGPSKPAVSIQVQLPKHLIQDLFNAFVHTPYSHHPIIPYDRLRASLAVCDWQPSALTPEDSVLVHCILALTSLVSTDPFIIGREPLPPECNNILTTLHPVKSITSDLRDIGKRREGVCHQLRLEALRQAQVEGVAIHESPENAASCFLLDALDNQYDSSNAYGTAFARQARALAEAWYRHPQPSNSLFGTRKLSARWRSFIVFDAIAALHLDRPISFSPHDERVLCGHDSLSLKELASLLKQGCNGMQFYAYFPSIVFQMTRLVREVYENISGPYARRNPLNLQTVKTYFCSLNCLHEICETYSKKADLLAEQNKRQYFARQSILDAVSLGWTNLAYYFYKTIKSWLEQSSLSNSYARSNRITVNSVVGFQAGANGAVRSDIGVDETGDLGRNRPSANSLRAELETIFVDARVLACKAAVEFSKMVHNILSISRLVQVKLVGGHLKTWVQFLVDATDGRVMSVSEGAQTLERLRDGLRIAGFYCTDYIGLGEAMDSHISVLKASAAAAAREAAHNLHPTPVSNHVPLAEVAPMAGIGTGVSPYDPNPLVSGYGPVGWNYHAFGYELEGMNAIAVQYQDSDY
ncbi:hypothetical protein D9758_009924 [Tetrapyrgos nigripes]|uniref:Zn(2)-C6 fungal-type domain-containing protein n=1 Tax=Tetrapyrgos nigripes TaxID=182062 RepID=A0A8H5FRM2_9AGAR|nr:hypothetical protein D9758_009924 [Tetrapyrgos nigripes]